MLIRTNLEKLNALSLRIKRLEEDISQISNQLVRTTKMTTQSVKYRSTDYQIRRACEKVINSADSISKTSRRLCDRLYNQGNILQNAVNMYRQNDNIERINKGALKNAGSNLKNYFGKSGVSGYTSKIPSSIYVKK